MFIFIEDDAGLILQGPKHDKQGKKGEFFYEYAQRMKMISASLIMYLN